MISTIKTADGAVVLATTPGATVSLMVRRRTALGAVLPVVLTLEPCEAMLMACELERAAHKAHAGATGVAA